MAIKIEIPADYPLLIKAVGESLAGYKGEANSFAKEVTHPLEVKLDASKAIEQVADAQIPVDQLSNTSAAEDMAGQDDDAGKSEQSTAELGAGGAHVAPGTHPSQDSTGKWLTDHNGVVHIPAVCGNAEKPFYASGPTKGQWKRKVGVTEENYAAVYANALSQVGSQQAASTTNQTQTDTSAQDAFGGDQQQQAGQAGQAGQAAVTPNDAFGAFTTICQMGDQAKTDMATKCFTDAGLANPSLIFSRPDLAQTIHAALAKICMGGG